LPGFFGEDMLQLFEIELRPFRSRESAWWASTLEYFPIPWHQKTSRDLCFIAFSSREPVSTSLENALSAGAAIPGLGSTWRTHACCPSSG
jgi:hypothetical protein